ncbi:MAG: 7-cyano-7-deazaguanine synthase QueC [Candidatus Hydrogenedentota bacterium]
MNEAVVLLSGGMDSSVTTAIAINENNKVNLIHITYRHRTAERELKAFNDIADYYNIKNRLVVDIDYLVKIGGSALIDRNIDIPISQKLTWSNRSEVDRMVVPLTYVPFRNGNFISIATSWAEVLGAGSIYIGVVYEDSSGYPDTRPEFIKKMEDAVNAGTKPETKITLKTPIIFLNKKEIVLKGVELKVPFHLTWSCYKNTDKACGKCDSCLLRIKGFENAGIKDPIVYL